MLQFKTENIRHKISIHDCKSWHTVYLQFTYACIKYLWQSKHNEKKIKQVQIVNYQRYLVNYQIRCRFISSSVHLHDVAVNSRLRQPCDTFMIVFNIKRIKAYLYNNGRIGWAKSSYRLWNTLKITTNGCLEVFFFFVIFVKLFEIEILLYPCQVLIKNKGKSLPI